MHRILEKQLSKNSIDKKKIPKKIKALFSDIDVTYEEFDRDRELISRSLDISSAELSEKNDQLLESNQLKDLFIDIMRHDILNPVGIVKTQGQLLMMDNEDAKEYSSYELILRSINKIETIVISAATYAKVSDVKKIEKEKLDLVLIIKEVCKSIMPRYKKAGIKLNNTLKGSMPIKASRVIEEVFLNLLTNALKYAVDGKRVDISAKQVGRRYVVSVKDYGDGIPDEFKEKVFTRLMRKEKEGVKGTGLGLAIVKKIIELHKGTVKITDNPQGGAIFVVTLPIGLSLKKV